MSDRSPDEASTPPPAASGAANTVWVVLLVLGGVLALWVIVGPWLFAPSNSTVPPDTRLLHLDLTPLSPNSPPLKLDDLRGKVTLINFWGTWCPPCRKEFPHLAEIEKHYRGNGDFRFVSISLGHGHPQDLDELRHETQAFLRLGGYDVPVYADIDRQTIGALSPAVDTGGVPLTLLVDRDGTITDVWAGFTTAAVDEMRLRLATLLGPKK
jgi:cytochrome c biogenesis protein CcmG, thiol:disulfide interchange protein DsbE